MADYSDPAPPPGFKAACDRYDKACSEMDIQFGKDGEREQRPTTQERSAACGELISSWNNLQDIASSS